MRYEPFESWAHVINAVRQGTWISPVSVNCAVLGANPCKVRVYPVGGAGASFWAGVGHLDRFRRRVGP